MTQIIPISQMEPLFQHKAASEETSAVSGIPFADILQESIQTMQETQKASTQDAYDLAMGNSDDLAGIMIRSAQATAALEMTVQVASRAVNAYKEILQMQV